MKRRTSLFLAGSSCLVVVAGLLSLLWVHFMSERALLFEIPGGYKGWIFIQYGNASCSRLLRKGEVRVVLIPPTGHVCTSDTRPEGFFSAQFDYVYPDGKRTNLRWSTSSGGDALVRMLTYNPQDKWEIDFVGNKEEFMHAGSPPYPWRKNLKDSDQNH